MTSNAQKASKSVASAATATVDGYLRNMSKRLRVPTAEGGRGTRRKMAMVTSADIRSSTVEEERGTNDDTNQVASDVDEWDEVELPTSFACVKKQETGEEVNGMKQMPADKTRADVVKQEALLSAPSVKAEAKEAVSSNGIPSAATHQFLKTEHVNVDEESGDHSIMDGAALPLVGQPRSFDAWRQRDPVYEAMMEQKDLLAAKKRSERIQRVCRSLFTLLGAMIRTRLLWRKAHHPKLLKRLLLLHEQSERNTKQVCDDDDAAARRARSYVFLEAVAAAKALVVEAAMPQYRKLSLSPAWVTCAKDTVQNRTSAAAKMLIEVINTYFRLEDSSALGRVGAMASSSGNEALTVLSHHVDSTAPASSQRDFSDWSGPFTPHHLSVRLAKVHGQVSRGRLVELSHPVYFSLIFLALARVAGLSCRLVVAVNLKTAREEARVVAESAHTDAVGGEDNREGEDSGGEDDAETRRRRPPPALSIFGGQGKRKTPGGSDIAGERGAKHPRSSARAAKDRHRVDDIKSKKLPTSCYWVEVWSPEREGYLSVNPCQGCATLWGAAYTFSVSGHAAVDATPRYISKYSSAYAYGRRLGSCQRNRFLWHDQLAWDDSRELSEILLATFNVAVPHTSALSQRQVQRENRQLHLLMYSEAVPTTLSVLHQHPLYVIESDLARHEGVYPKDGSTTVGSVKGHMVYKRSAIVSLRSRDGWLREGRSLLSDDQPPYKVVAPPASRPFAAPSTFYGRWQTQLFEPLPLTADDPPSIPLHGRTLWYILLDKAPPPGMVHMRQPQISRVARRMKLQFGLAVIGFERRRSDEHRRGHWETIIDGIVVREVDSAKLLRAYEEWVELVQEQEAAKRRQRALHWWLLMVQRMMALKRLQDQYAKGLSAGTMPTQ